MIVDVLSGLAVVGALWMYFFIVGRLALSIIPSPDSAGDGTEALVEVLVSTGVGVGLVIFLLFVLGALGFFTTVGISASATALLAVVAAARIRQVKSFGSVVEEAVRPLRSCANWGWIVSYGFALPTVATALLPATAPDSITYHLSHAADWARTGRLGVDQYLLFPLFAFNFELLFAAFIALHIERYVQFVAWMTFVWSTTGAYALARYLLLRAGIARFPATVGALCGAGVFASLPMALQYAEVPYIDIPAGFLLLSALGGAVLAVEKPRRYLAAVAIAGGCYIGIKISLIAFIPLFAAIILIVGLRSKMSRVAVGFYVLGFVLLASPWYVLNSLVAGDPVSPTLNILLGRVDPFWSAPEYHWLTNHMHTGPISIAMSPITYFTSDCPSYSVLFLFVPTIAAIALSFSKRKPWTVQSIVLYVAVTYALLAIAVPSSMGTARYLLQAYAAYMVALVLSTFQALTWLGGRIPVLRGSPVASAISIVLLALLAVPSAGSTYDFTTVRSALDAVPGAIADPERYLANQVYGYYEAEDLISLVSAARSDARVLAVGFENTAYFFRRAGVVSVGLHFGPGRYEDLKTAIALGQVAEYVKRFDVAAVMDFNANYTGPTVLGPELEESLRRQLIADNFVDDSMLSDNISEFVRADVLQSAHKLGYTTSQLRVADIHSNAVDMLAASSRVHGSALSLTPAVGAVYLLTWPAPQGRVSSVTIVSGNDYRLDHVDIGPAGMLTMQVAKVYAIGTAAIGWVDEVRFGKRSRIFTLTCPPARGDNIVWNPVSIPVRAGKDVSLILGATSQPDGGTADWIAFANPFLVGASFASPNPQHPRGIHVGAHARAGTHA